MPTYKTPRYKKAVTDTERRVVALTRREMSAAEIAQATGLNKRTVVRIRSRMGVAKGPAQPRLTEEKMAAIQQMIDDDASHAEICRTLHVNRETLTRHFPGTAWSPERGYLLAAEVSKITRRARREGVPL